MTTVTQADAAEAVRAVNSANDQNKKVQSKYKKAAQDLVGAIKDKNESMVRLYRKRMLEVMKEVADVIQSVEYGISAVTALQEDEKYVERQFAAIERMMQCVSKARTVLTKELVEGKKLDRAANKALDELTNDQEDAASEYAHLEDIANEVEARLDRVRPTAKKHELAAKKAIAAKDQKALTAARMALLDLEFGKWKMIATVNLPKVKAFQKKYPESELKTEAQWLHDSFTSQRDAFAEFEKKTTDLVRLGQIASGSPDGSGGADIDVAKAAKVLGIDSGNRAKLAKVLAGSPRTYEKSLSLLAAKLNLDEQNGRKLVLKLQKARVLTV